MKPKKFQTLDLFLSAYLFLNQLKPELVIINSKVIFQFNISDDLYKLIERFNSDSSVPVGSYATAVKTLKAKMMALKQERQG